MRIKDDADLLVFISHYTWAKLKQKIVNLQNYYIYTFFAWYYYVNTFFVVFQLGQLIFKTTSLGNSKMWSTILYLQN